MLLSYQYNDLSDEKIQELIQRNVDPLNTIQDQVAAILQDVKVNGDQSLIAYTERFDQVKLQQLFLDNLDINVIASAIGRTEQRALEIAFNNIHRFHQTQLKREPKVETMPGVICWREPRPIERVGIYVPGGTAVLPSTLLMLGIPARIAGCKEIIVCSPPQKDGKINPYIAYCLQLLKIERIYTIGGAQAIAAMAYGTESIPKVDKIFGPGNQFVTKAKSMVQAISNTAIDMPAGPSEVLVIADETANPSFIAADLLAQAEHGIDSQAILVCTSFKLLEQVNSEIKDQLSRLPRAGIATKALANSYAIITDSLSTAMEFSNKYAPEHLIVQSDHFERVIKDVAHAGSVFLGHLTPESAGDYATGTNHTLPTSGYAKAYSGVSVDSFVKKITFQQLSQQGINNVGPTVEILAEIEGLRAHKTAISYRLKKQ